MANPKYNAEIFFYKPRGQFETLINVLGSSSIEYLWYGSTAIINFVFQCGDYMRQIVAIPCIHLSHVIVAPFFSV